MNAREYAGRGADYLESGQYDKAVADLTEAINLEPRNDDIDSFYNLRGTAYGNQKKYEEALSDFETALRLNPNNSEVRKKVDFIKTVIEETKFSGSYPSSSYSADYTSSGSKKMKTIAMIIQIAASISCFISAIAEKSNSWWVACILVVIGAIFFCRIFFTNKGIISMILIILWSAVFIVLTVTDDDYTPLVGISGIVYAIGIDVAAILTFMAKRK